MFELEQEGKGGREAEGDRKCILVKVLGHKKFQSDDTHKLSLAHDVLCSMTHQI